jgi:hypothetical protein
MEQTFLAIISLLAAGYAFFSKQPKMGLGFLIYTGAFILLMPGLSSGIWTNVLIASAMVLFVAGSLVMIYKKKKIEPEKVDENKPTE